VGSTRPCGTKAQRETLGRDIDRSCEGTDRSSLPSRNLREDVSRGAEAVEAERLAVTGGQRGTPAGEPGAQQGSERHVGAGLGEREGIARIGDRRGREATVARISGENRPIAKILHIAQAVGTGAAVAGDDRHLWVGQLAIDDMQIRAADAAGGHLHANLAWSGLAVGEIRQLERGPKLLQHHRLHGVLRFRSRLIGNVPHAPAAAHPMESPKRRETGAVSSNDDQASMMTLSALVSAA